MELKDLAGLSEPATKLVEAVSACIGTLYHPVHIRRTAKAEAEALLILEEARVRKGEIATRAALRTSQQEVRRQENIESVIDESMHLLPPEVSSDPVSQDWIAQFMDACQDISDREMQALWSRVLVGEVAKPSSYSRRTIASLRQMDKEDAEAFRLACSLMWSGGPYRFLPAPFGHVGILEEYGLGYYALTELNSIGVISFDLKKTAMRFEELDGEILRYYGKEHQVEPVRSLQVIPFTRTGAELSTVVDSGPNWDYYTEMMDTLRASGLIAAQAGEEERLT